MSKYLVENIAGGTTSFDDLDDAVKMADDDMSVPYVIDVTDNRRRPVFMGTLGEYGQTFSELMNEEWTL